MGDTQRVSLTINADEPLSLGPLSVEVVPEEGDSIEFAMTSGYRTHAVEVLPGRYAVIARRPNGERLRRMVTVSAGSPATVRLADAIPRSPNEFMNPETVRGDITSGMRFGEPAGVLQGFVGDTLRSVTAARPIGEEPVERRLNLCAWVQKGEMPPQLSPEQGPSFLKLRVDNRCLAVGLLDESGFGPIIMAPPFRQPLEITFLAEGVAARAGARYLNPSGQRAPVALATPKEAPVADLLAALGAPALEQAAAIWEQNFGSLAHVDNALQMLLDKFVHPTEALLGAHFLLRFLPDKLPLKWADNLVRAAPKAADGPVIAAWLRILSSSDDVRALSAGRVDRDVQRLLSEALARPTTLFARTRLLLAEGLRLRPQLTTLLAHSPRWLAEKLTPGSRADADRALPADFLNYGAHAGGLEAFWGTDPFSPGPKRRAQTWTGLELLGVTLRGARFVRPGSTGSASLQA